MEHFFTVVKQSREDGFALLMVAFFALMIMTASFMGASSVVFYRQRIAGDAVRSVQSYYAAESGAEDALLRLKNNPQITPVSYNFSVGSAVANVSVPAAFGGERAVISEGSGGGLSKKIQAVYGVDGQGVSFFYGAQVGAGGLQMANGSRIMGNVFSSGNITGSGIIDNNVMVAGNGKSIQGVYVGGDVLAYSCLSPANVENLTYVVGGAHTCQVRGTTLSQSSEIPVQPMPISQSQIDGWKAEAEQGGVITGNVVVANGQTRILGPVKITGSLTVSNGATVKITGTVFVAGNIVSSNNSLIKLDNSYGPLGGVLLSDGSITVSNNAVFSGTGQAGSYLLVLSTNTSNSAIIISNNATGAIFYTSSGGITISNNAQIKEAAGYKLILSNNAVVQYESGLQNTFFSNGPGGSWKIKSWSEI